MKSRKRLQDLEDLHYSLEAGIDHGTGATNIKAPWLKNYLIPQFSGDIRERPIIFLRDFEQYLKAVDLRRRDFPFLIRSCLEGNAREWWNLVQSIDGDQSTPPSVSKILNSLSRHFTEEVKAAFNDDDRHYQGNRNRGC